jgi:uncharacterized membrane protein YozB (DUF420 family)
MLSVTDLPALNATLNAISTVFLMTGYVLIRRRRIAQHRLCMIAAFTTSVLFLVSYLVYHANVGSVPFQGQGPIRAIYFTILITHIILAAAIVPLVLVTLTRALRKQYVTHRAIARWTFPIWLYVSVTGVIVYLMLYQM